MQPSPRLRASWLSCCGRTQAARWCVEQGYLEEDFAPEKYVPKYKVIRILKQAKSAT